MEAVGQRAGREAHPFPGPRFDVARKTAASGPAHISMNGEGRRGAGLGLYLTILDFTIVGNSRLASISSRTKSYVVYQMW